MSALSTSMHHWCPLMMGHVVRAQRVASMVALVWLACCLWHCWAAQPPGTGEERNRSRASKEWPIRGNLSQSQRGTIVSSKTSNWGSATSGINYMDADHACVYLLYSTCVLTIIILHPNGHICQWLPYMYLLFSKPNLHWTQADSGDLWTFH